MLELSPAELTRYQEDGFFVREAIFLPEELQLLGDAADRVATIAQRLSERGHTYLLDGKRFVDADHVTIQFEHEAGSEQVRVIEPVHELDPQFDALVDDPRIVRPMCGLIGQAPVALWTAKLNLKVAENGSGFGWHQDSPYWIHDCAHVDLLPNVMVAFDDASEANGCLRVVRGSHHQGCLPGTSDGTQLGGFFTSPDHFDESQQVALEVPAGSLMFFSPHAVHGSQPNRSGLPRRAIVLTYQPGDQPMLKDGCVRNALGH